MATKVLTIKSSVRICSIIRRVVRNQKPAPQLSRNRNASRRAIPMSGIIYLVGLVVVVLAILSFFGLR
jgi:hypothetical protein